MQNISTTGVGSSRQGQISEGWSVEALREINDKDSISFVTFDSTGKLIPYTGEDILYVVSKMQSPNKIESGTMVYLTDNEIIGVKKSVLPAGLTLGKKLASTNTGFVAATTATGTNAFVYSMGGNSEYAHIKLHLNEITKAEGV